MGERAVGIQAQNILGQGWLGDDMTMQEVVEVEWGMVKG